MILVGDNLHWTENREITTEQAQSFAQNHNLDYFEVSSRDATGIRDAFDCLFDKVDK